jgi:hypothetical protein
MFDLRPEEVWAFLAHRGIIPPRDHEEGQIHEITIIPSAKRWLGLIESKAVLLFVSFE